MTQTTRTPYGILHSERLGVARQTFDTTGLLSMAEAVDALVLAFRGEDGMREKLLRLHGMAHSVLHGVGMSAPAGENLAELATELNDEVVEAIATLRQFQPALRALSELAAAE